MYLLGMTKFFSEQNKINPTGPGDFSRGQFSMMRRVFDQVFREAEVPADSLDRGLRLARMILDLGKTRPIEATLYAAALRFALEDNSPRSQRTQEIKAFSSGPRAIAENGGHTGDRHTHTLQTNSV